MELPRNNQFHIYRINRIDQCHKLLNSSHVCVTEAQSIADEIIILMGSGQKSIDKHISLICYKLIEALVK